MADKTDTATLLNLLEGLCRDFQAYRHIAKSAYPKWAAELNAYRQANETRVSRLFDEVYADLQNGLPLPTSKLTEILEKVAL